MIQPIGYAEFPAPLRYLREIARYVNIYAADRVNEIDKRVKINRDYVIYIHAGYFFNRLAARVQAVAVSLFAVSVGKIYLFHFAQARYAHIQVARYGYHRRFVIGGVNA